jgi:arsenite-transporting ATPase
MVESEFAPTL